MVGEALLEDGSGPPLIQDGLRPPERLPLASARAVAWVVLFVVGLLLGSGLVAAGSRGRWGASDGSLELAGLRPALAVRGADLDAIVAEVEEGGYPAQVDGLPITSIRQSLVPLIGACYWPTAALRPAVLLYRERAPDAALANLAKIPGLEARHLAVNVGQMYDRYEVIDANADKILHTLPWNPHALFVKALYAHAFKEADAFREHSRLLQRESPTSWGALDRAVGDVALAWDARRYPPYKPDTLPAEWSPEKAVLVVLGCPVRPNGTPEPCLEERLNATLKLAGRLPRSQIITSGGAVSSEHPEGPFMRDWLVHRGIATERIFVDGSARDTLGNCLYVASWLRENRVSNIVLITSTWHSPRAELNLRGLLERQGVVASVVAVGAGRADYATEDALEARLDLERKASHRDAVRARGLFSACDF